MGQGKILNSQVFDSYKKGVMLQKGVKLRINCVGS